MYKLIPILVITTLFSSCDPYQIIYLKNNRSLDLDVYVTYSNRYLDTIKQISYIDSLIDVGKASTRIEFTQSLRPDIIDNNNYHFIIPKKSTVLVEPITIGYPIKMILISNDSIIDTFKFDFEIKNLKSLKEKGIIVKKGLSTYTIEVKN